MRSPTITAQWGPGTAFLPFLNPLYIRRSDIIMSIKSRRHVGRILNVNEAGLKCENRMILIPTLLADGAFRLVYDSELKRVQAFANLRRCNAVNYTSSITPIWWRQLLHTELRHCYPAPHVLTSATCTGRHIVETNVHLGKQQNLRCHHQIFISCS